MAGTARDCTRLMIPNSKRSLVTLTTDDPPFDQGLDLSLPSLLTLPAALRYPCLQCEFWRCLSNSQLPVAKSVELWNPSGRMLHLDLSRSWFAGHFQDTNRISEVARYHLVDLSSMLLS